MILSENIARTQLAPQVAGDQPQEAGVEEPRAAGHRSIVSARGRDIGAMSVWGLIFIDRLIERSVQHGHHRRIDQLTLFGERLLLKRVMMAKLAEAGCELPLEPPVRGIDREIVRAEFYLTTPVDGTKHQKEEQRRKRFNRALERACEKQLIGVREIGTITYLWLQLAQPSEDEEF
jgi:hypothetical protein